MSIASKLSNLVAIRNGIRSRLITFGLVTSTVKLIDCKTALESMTDNTKKTTVASPIKGEFFSGVSQKIFGSVGEGYCSSNSVVEVPVTNLISSNIKSGVNVGGVVGSFVGYCYKTVVSVSGKSSISVTHGLGVVPKGIVVIGDASSEIKYGIYDGTILKDGYGHGWFKDAVYLQLSGSLSSITATITSPYSNYKFTGTYSVMVY